MNLFQFDYDSLAGELLKFSKEAGSSDDAARDLFKELVATFEQRLSSLSFDTHSDISVCTNLVLAAVYPKFADFLLEGAHSKGMSAEKLKLENRECALLVLQSALHGVTCFDDQADRKTGAKKLAQHIVSPLPTPTTPFDEKDPYMTFD